MAWNSFRVFALIIFASSAVLGQKNRYMVFFTDKNNSPYSISEPSAFLSEKAIARRNAQGIDITLEDVPVNAAYVDGVKNTGAEVYYPTRWMNGLLVQCESSVVPAITVLPYVESVELVAPNAPLLPNGRIKFGQGIRGAKAGVTDTQLDMIGIPQMHADGFRGEGVTIAVLDAGFPGVDNAVPFSHLITDEQIDLNVSKDYVTNSDNVFQFDGHGTAVLSIIGALVEGAYTGGAYEAMFQLYVTEEVATEYRVEEYNWLFAAERADSAGVDIIQSSVGYYDFQDNSMDYFKSQLDGKSTIVTRAAQMAADRGIVVVVSAGNEGSNSWQTVTPPADAVDVLAVGAVNDAMTGANFSSTGPTADLRIKPDVAAMGAGTSIILPNGNSIRSNGTSYAAPLITSLVAGVWQRYPFLTNREVMDLIRSSASLADEPNNTLGYGIPSYGAVVSYVEKLIAEDFFQLYPNPSFTNTLRIRTRFPQDVSDCVFQIISVNGQLVQNTTLNFSSLEREYVHDISSLSSGLYFIRMQWNGQKYVIRFVKG
jgi:serine protease AprX